MGTLKRQRLADQLGPDSLALQRRLKSVFDSHAVLNPGKAI
ncbi:FAD-linked oxidase C-terminal domain-containing protein [Streptomyces sp. NPDC058439]